MLNEESLIIHINRLRPLDIKHGDAYARGQNDTVDRVIAVIQRMVKDQEKGEGR